MFSTDDSMPPSDPPEPTPAPSQKVTQRMLQIRELIKEGAYPDKDELAERITDAGIKPRS